jgi:isoleucyl-tRNA synthetase
MNKDISQKTAPDSKSEIAKREEAILHFWETNNIFKKSEEKEAPKGEFVFYDGPPFATGLPHYGSLLSSVIKDVVPRYKTMRGFRVHRRWGWDCHGLPIENMIEKELGLKSKKDILEIGIAIFNEACRKSVLRYARDWKKYVERIGRWVHFESAYMTMDNSYIESVWWFLKNMHDKELLYEGRKVLLYCPRCETPLAKAEVAMDNSYQDVTEESVYVKFKIKNPEKHNLPQNTSLLAWTTTPWTLPSNMALAVGKNIHYVVVKTQEENHLVFAKDRRDALYRDAEVVKELTGEELLGISYEPLFLLEKVAIAKKTKMHTVLPADFVTTEDGAGIVHIAPMYGEDDYQLGLANDLPMVPLLDASGHFTHDAPKQVAGDYFKKGEKNIKENLEGRDLIFKRENHTHSYPHCHRCGTALIYSALVSWFLNIQKVKNKMLKTNEHINWFPEHLKHGRYKHNLETAPDWTISRNRFWASPLPIWRHPKTDEIMVIGSIAELKEHTKTSGNRYIMMRHGEAESNVQSIISSHTDNPHHLTKKGIQEVTESITKLPKIDLIVTSPLVRTKETTDIIAKTLAIPKERIVVDDRLSEINLSTLNNKHITSYWALFPTYEERFAKGPEGGESILDVKKRVGSLLYEIEKNYSHKTILFVTHEYLVWMLQSVVGGMNNDEAVRLKSIENDFIKTGEIREFSFIPLPHNDDYALDLHRPYIDSIALCAKDGEELIRVPEVIDGWVESGSMPFAQHHYPFEGSDVFEPSGGFFKKQKGYPGDFVAEYIAQTRTWFYYMHAVSVMQFGSASFKNVVTTGNILAEDGAKMSKSKGNYTDPFKNLDSFGADALRYYLMSGVVMQAEDTRFVDAEVREVHNRVINILWNTFKFYDLYKNFYDPAYIPSESPHILDAWVLSRLSQVIRETTEQLDAYNTVRATRVMRAFVDDFSTWYVRRSRDRFKSDDNDDRGYALSTTQFVLMEFSKVIAPVMPFIAESIYQGVGGSPESVHLCDWPEAGEVVDDLLVEMSRVRDIVSQGLEARATAGIKVRQPLTMLTIPKTMFPSRVEFHELIKDEVNVKEVRSGEGESVVLDTAITDTLKREGIARELIRHIQQLRKDSNRTPQDIIKLSVDTDEEIRKIILEFENTVKKTALLSEIVFMRLASDSLSIEGHDIKLELS